MTTQQFESLSIKEKTRVIQSHSTPLYSTDQTGYKVSLYSLHHYFVEVKQNLVTKNIESILVRMGAEG